MTVAAPSTRSHQWEPEELLRLAERCEKETAEYDLGLDHEIGRSLSSDGNYSYRPFTASLDAAMTLVPDGMLWMLTNGGLADRSQPNLNRATAICGPWESTNHEAYPKVEAATPALALTAAALRARAATPPEGHNGH
jgi:hypothetical protein